MQGIERFGEAVRRAGARVLDDDQVESCTVADAPVPNLVYAILVGAREGSAWLQLDTGSGATTISAGNPLVAGLELEAGGEAVGVSGIPQGYRLARDLVISFAGFETTVDAQVVEATHGGCGPDGLLGRDALARCALVLSQGSVAIACH
jgi:hypothetical protein